MQYDRGMSAEPLPGAPATPPMLRVGWLDVGHGHHVYYEQTGAPDGIVALLLHGGPGSSSTSRHREILDATRYRIVQFDQRGCGRSTPLGETAHNHTDALIEDIETLRRHLGIERWLVVGGSWGAALAVVYAARYRDRVCGVLVRGMFLTSQADLDWFFHGVAAFAPEAHAEFMAVIPQRWRRRVVTYLDRRLANPCVHDQHAWRVASAWQVYEDKLDRSSSAASNVSVPDVDAERRLFARYRVQAHYLARRCFLGEAAVIRAASALRGVPLALVHGTHDRICRPCNAWRVQRACAGSRLAWADEAGHTPWHPQTFRLLREATDGFAAMGDFTQWPVPTTVANR